MGSLHRRQILYSRDCDHTVTLICWRACRTTHENYKKSLITYIRQTMPVQLLESPFSLEDLLINWKHWTFPQCIEYVVLYIYHKAFSIGRFTQSYLLQWYFAFVGWPYRLVEDLGFASEIKLASDKQHGWSKQCKTCLTQWISLHYSQSADCLKSRRTTTWLEEKRILIVLWSLNTRTYTVYSCIMKL